MNLLATRVFGLALLMCVALTALAAPGDTSVVFGGYNAQTGNWFGTTVPITGDFDRTHVFDGDLSPQQANVLLRLDNFETKSDQSPGTLKVRSNLFGTTDLSSLVFSVGGWLQLNSFASYSDRLTFQEGVGTGSYRMVLEQTSALLRSGDGNASVRTAVFSGSTKVLDGVQSIGGTVQYISDPIPFQFGVPTALLSVSSQSVAELRSVNSQTVSGVATSDASHTLIVKGLLVYDAQGLPLFNVSVSSQTGYLYQPVPEPATLAALGLGGFVVLNRRRRA